MDLFKDLHGKQILESISYFNNLCVQLQSDKLFNGLSTMDYNNSVIPEKNQLTKKLVPYCFC